MTKKSTGFYMRIIHRYLGFFLVGIMAMYAISGIVLIFRNTDFLKNVQQVEKKIEPNVSEEELGQQLKIKRLKVEREEGDIYYFRDGTYNKSTGVANYTVKELPFILDRMTHIHKAKSGDPLYILNIFFGIALLFFVISAFWMFLPTSPTFRKGMYFTLAGIVLTLLLMFV